MQQTSTQQILNLLHFFFKNVDITVKYCTSKIWHNFIEYLILKTPIICQFSTFDPGFRPYNFSSVVITKCRIYYWLRKEHQFSNLILLCRKVYPPHFQGKLK